MHHHELVVKADKTKLGCFALIVAVTQKNLFSLTSNLFQVSYDIDTQSNSTHIHVEWYGFRDKEDTTFAVGLGTAPGIDDVMRFSEHGMSPEGRKVLSGFTLVDYKVRNISINLLRNVFIL